MEPIKELSDRLKDYGCDDKNCIVTREEHLTVTPMKLFETLVKIGVILEEIEKGTTYIVSVKAGFLNMNTAVIVLNYQDDRLFLAGYAPEGIINQHTSEKAIGKVVDGLK